MKTYVRRYNRCTWMAIIAGVFMVMTVALIIPVLAWLLLSIFSGVIIVGALGIGGLNKFNDTLLYIALVDSLFGLLFLVGWIMCQFEVEDVIPVTYESQMRKRNNGPSTYGSMRSNYSICTTRSSEMRSLNGSTIINCGKNP